jgi:hypothetical protein
VKIKVETAKCELRDGVGGGELVKLVKLVKAGCFLA